MRKKLISVVVSSLIAFSITGCGSDDKSPTPIPKPKNYQGVIPNYSSSYVDQKFSLEPIKCSNVDVSAIVNNAPQSVKHAEQTAIELIQNLQAHIISDACINRGRILNRPAVVTRVKEGVDELVTVKSQANSRNSSELTSWQVSEKNYSKNIIDTHNRGFYIETSSDKSSKKRTDVLHIFNDDGTNKKVSRVLLQKDSNGPRDIRSALTVEEYNKEGKLIELRMSVRIAADNQIYVITAGIKPGLGALTYIKKCDHNGAASSNDFMRACNDTWTPLAYDEKGTVSTTEDKVAALFNAFKLGVNKISGDSMMPEQVFYFGKTEFDYFASNDFTELMSVISSLIPAPIPAPIPTPALENDFPKVSKISVTKASINSISISWIPVSGAAFYLLQRQGLDTQVNTQNPRPTIVPLINPSLTTYTDNELATGRYQYFITACKEQAKCSLPLQSDIVTL